MPINLNQFRGEIGSFYNRIGFFSQASFSLKNCFKESIQYLNCIIWTLSLSTLNPLDAFCYIFNLLFLSCYIFTIYCFDILRTHNGSVFMCDYIFQLWLSFLLIKLSSDVELNPGPRLDSLYNFSISYWNLNGIMAHNYEKLSNLIAFNSTKKFDVICLSETFLNSETLSNDDNLMIPGYNFVRSDHPSNSKRGGVCIYYKSSLPIKVLDINLLQECINFELIIGDKLCSFTVLYRSPNQTNDQFEEFLSNLELNLEFIANKNPFLVTMLGDFNAKSQNWYNHGVTSPEGTDLDILTRQYGLKQVINEPTYLANNYMSCIDLIFTSESNLIMETGTFPSLHPKCHHQIIYANFDLKIHYPPQYSREIWHYLDTNTNLIQQAINSVDWDTFLDLPDVNLQVSRFNEVILNVMSNFIPHETIVCDDKDPPWVNQHIKRLLHDNRQIYKSLKCFKNNLILKQQFKNSQEYLNNEIEKSKVNYFKKLSDKLSSESSSCKTYWTLLKTFLSNTKIPCIPPLLHQNKYVVDFKEKCDLFNDFFSDQCSVIATNSVLPPDCLKLTNNSLSNVDISSEDILNIIRTLNPNKAHGHDGISTRMLKICDESICKPLHIIFKNCIESGKFPLEWKKANVVPIYKKGNKQFIKNYRPVSLLCICGKIFERILYNNLYKYLSSNNLITSKQSGFKAGDSCINQLLSITHGIYESLDQGYEVRGVFLDISKAFDRVWHEGLTYKLEKNGIEGKLLNLFNDFLRYRKQRVVLNGQVSDWKLVNAGVPQGSILGPLFFLLYINDIADDLQCDVKIFADDTSLFSTTYDPNDCATLLNNDLCTIQNWANQWKMSFNPDPSKQAQEVIFSHKINKPNHPPLTFNNNVIDSISHQKHLGVILDQKLNFQEHIEQILSKINRSLGLLRKFNSILPRSSLLTIYKAFIRPHLDYGDIIFDQAFNNSFQSKMENIQYKACLAITGAIQGTSMVKLYSELGLESLQSRRWMRKLCFFYRVYNKQMPTYLTDVIPARNENYNLRNRMNVNLMRVNHNFFKNSFFPSTIIEWNKLDLEIRTSVNVASFRKKILKFIKPSANSIFGIHNPMGIKLMCRLRLGLSHLREHKFKHGFLDTIDPMCSCGRGIENTAHFFLHCSLFDTKRTTLLNGITNINSDILNRIDSEIVQLLLYGDPNFSIPINKSILQLSIEFILNSERFISYLYQ